MTEIKKVDTGHNWIQIQSMKWNDYIKITSTHKRVHLRTNKPHYKHTEKYYMNKTCKIRRDFHLCLVKLWSTNVRNIQGEK